MKDSFRMGRDRLTGRFVPIDETHDNSSRFELIEFDEKLEEFRKLIYEPEHEVGTGVCWCGIVYTKEEGEMEMTHKAQKDELVDFVRENFQPVENK